jgi:hypothetical protein
MTDRTLMSVNGPKVLTICLLEIPMEHKPCRMGLSNPPIAANSGRIWV